MSGGGPHGIKFLGALQELEEAGVWRRDEIQHVFAVSVSSIVAVLVGLGFEWDTISQYVIQRPWESVAGTIDNLFEVYNTCGLVGPEYFELFFKPFLSAKDLSLNITMKEFYEFCHIHMHFYTVNINAYTLVEISHETFPDIPLIQAVHMSCALPMLVSPVFLDEMCYLDGGMLCNYPMRQCLEYLKKTTSPPLEGDEDKITESILGIVKFIVPKKTTLITSSDNLISYVLNLLEITIRNAKGYVTTQNNSGLVPNEVALSGEQMNFIMLQNAMLNKPFRQNLYTQGQEEAREFVKTKRDRCVSLPMVDLLTEPSSKTA